MEPRRSKGALTAGFVLIAVGSFFIISTLLRGFHIVERDTEMFRVLMVIDSYFPFSFVPVFLKASICLFLGVRLINPKANGATPKQDPVVTIGKGMRNIVGLFILIMGVVIMAGSMIIGGSGASLSDIFSLLPFILWNIVPNVLFFVVAKKIDTPGRLLMPAIVICAMQIAVISAFVTTTSSTGGLIFLSAPVIVGIVAGFAYLIGVGVDWLNEKIVSRLSLDEVRKRRAGWIFSISISLLFTILAGVFLVTNYQRGAEEQRRVIAERRTKRAQ